MIRAKLRCMSDSEELGNVRQIRLAAVIPKKGLPNFAENQMFWSYTPSGSMHLTYEISPGVPSEFQVGDFYYIDMVKQPDVHEDRVGLWNLTERHNWLGGSAQVKFQLARATGLLRNATLELSLSNDAAGAKNHIGDVAYGWKITIERAHGAELE